MCYLLKLKSKWVKTILKRPQVLTQMKNIKIVRSDVMVRVQTLVSPLVCVGYCLSGKNKNTFKTWQNWLFNMSYYVWQLVNCLSYPKKREGINSPNYEGYYWNNFFFLIDVTKIISNSHGGNMGHL